MFSTIRIEFTVFEGYIRAEQELQTVDLAIFIGVSYNHIIILGPIYIALRSIAS